MALNLKTEKTMVKDNTDRVKNAESSIIQQALEIALRVKADTFNALEGRVTNAESSLSIQAQQIALRVASTDFNGETIASLINQTASAVKIQASHIELEGLVTANSYFKILADGSIEAVNAKLSGAITATKMVSTSSAALYGEIGATDGNVGLGLFDTRYGANPYFKVRELGSSASGFNGFQIVDEFGQVRLSVEESLTRIFGPGGITWLRLTEQSVIISTPGKMETWQ